MKKNLLIALFLFATAANGQTFIQKNDFPGGPRYKMSTVSNGSEIFCGLGIDNGGVMHNDLWKYETTNDTWTQLNNFPFAARRNASLAKINGNLYAGFGYDGTASLNDWWLYDSINDSWLQKTGLPADPRYWTSIFEWNGKGYLVGGEKYNGSYTAYNEMWEYDPAIDQWTQIGNFPGSARCNTFCQQSGNNIFYGLGEAANSSYFSDMYKYDCNAQTWTGIASIPPTVNVPVADGGAWWSAAYNNKIILMSIDITGTVPDDYLSIYAYDIASDSWTIYPLANLAGNRFMGICGQYGSKAYEGAGLDHSGSAFQDLWEIDLASLLAGLAEHNPGLNTIQVFVTDKVIHCSINADAFPDDKLFFELFDQNGKLVSTSCLKCTSSIDVKNAVTGNYVYLIRSEKRNLKTGKIFIY